MGVWLRVGLGIVWIFLVAWVTLIPVPLTEPGTGPGVTYCLICGSRGAADAVLNTVMFLPLGFLVGIRRALLAGLLASGLIEALQLYVPGRNPAVSDLLWNTTGAALGGVVAAILVRWRAKPRSLGWPVLAASLPTLYVGLAGVLSEPTGTDARYFGQWTPDLAHLAEYGGQVVSAALNGAPLRPGPFPPENPSPSISGDLRVEVTVVVGEATEGIAPIVSVYDAEQQEIFLLGAQGDDVVWRLRDRALAARFDLREVRADDALTGTAVGDTLRLAAIRTDGNLCLVVENREACGLGFRPEETWRFLMNLEGASPPARTGLNLGWMATLFLLLGVVGGSRADLVRFGAGSAAALVGIALVTPLLLPGPAGWTGLVAGIMAGRVARPLVRSVLEPTQGMSGAAGPAGAVPAEGVGSGSGQGGP